MLQALQGTSRQMQVPHGFTVRKLAPECLHYLLHMPCENVKGPSMQSDFGPAAVQQCRQQDNDQQWHAPGCLYHDYSLC
jgi:hypothetical protein